MRRARFIILKLRLLGVPVAARSRRASLLRLSIVALALAAGLVTVSAAGARSTAEFVPCRALAAASTPSEEARDCAIRGAISGELREGDVTTTWNGNVVFRQRFKSGDPAWFFVLGTGSSVHWTTSGTAQGCTVTGGGTLIATRLVGVLDVDERVRSGVWHWGMEVDVREPRSGEQLMPVTETCPGGDNVKDIARGFAKGFMFARNNDISEPGPVVETNGLAFTGRRTGPAGETMTWSLKSRVFADETSQHGVDFIKRWEKLAERCTSNGKKARNGPFVCAYEDSLGYCTIGYGHLIGKRHCNAADHRLRWTPEESETTLLRELKKPEFEGKVHTFSKSYGLNQCQFDALMSFVYNVSTRSWVSLTAGLPLEGWENQVAQRLLKYNMGFDQKTKMNIVLPGLVQRRFAELKWFLSRPCPCKGVAGPPLPRSP